jgi:hypothetical protein
VFDKKPSYAYNPSVQKTDTKFRPDTLHIKPPFGRTLGLALVLIMIVSAIGEGSLRFLISKSYIPVPLIGTWVPEFDIKINRLDALKQKQGHIDCIFLGSSMVDWGFNPEIFAQAYENETGDQINCFNMGLPTLTAGPAGKVAELLVYRYQPDLLIFGATARDYSNITGGATKPLNWDPWIKYSLGQFNLQGWLADHSMFYRFLRYQYNRMNPGFDTVSLQLEKQLNEYGFLPTNETSEVKDFDFLLKDFEIYEPDFGGLKYMVQLQSSELRILVVELPINPAFFPYYVEDGIEAYEEKFFTPISKFLKSKKVLFWQTQADVVPLIPAEGWKDRLHMNKTGARVFSEWLGKQFAESVKTGTIKDPFR